ncbi:hypothetical protein ACFQ4N_17805 [Oceanobacillus iheyensis]|uniref:hypothetical protein n=1 Tax=Oceanobacillus iheyensis TaxID=182710 RepID=UPI003641F9E8
MEISFGLIIILSLVFYFILYVVIETAVRRGIDSSKTNGLIEELYKKVREEE